MNYERERHLAEQRTKVALANNDWPVAAYNLFHASRLTLRMAQDSQGRTRTSLMRLAKRYETRGDRARARATAGGDARPAIARQHPIATDGKGDTDDAGLTSIVAERPDTRIADVAGMHEVKEIIHSQIVLPMRHAAVYAEYRLKPGSGVLMYGPPGTGKTLMARAIAGEVDAAFIPIEMKRVLSKWFGETERILGALFDAAKQYPRAVVFIDEAEALFPKRAFTNSSVMARVVPQLLQLINGLDPTKNCLLLLGATNRPWLMDEAATRPGRFGRLVYVGPPDHVARATMLDRAMRGAPCHALDFDALATKTEGYSGADIAGERDSICVEAKLLALNRTLQRGRGEAGLPPEPVTMADFETAIERSVSSLRTLELERFERFRREHDKPWPAVASAPPHEVGPGAPGAGVK